MICNSYEFFNEKMKLWHLNNFYWFYFVCFIFRLWSWRGEEIREREEEARAIGKEETRTNGEKRSQVEKRGNEENR